MIELICDAKRMRQKKSVSKIKNYEEYTISFQHYSQVAYNTANNRWNDEKNQTQRNFEQIHATISRENKI